MGCRGLVASFSWKVKDFFLDLLPFVTAYEIEYQPGLAAIRFAVHLRSSPYLRVTARY